MVINITCLKIPGNGFISAAFEYPSMTNKEIIQYTSVLITQGPRRKKNDRGQRSAFPSETSRFKPVILAHRGSALPWLVNDRAALRLRRIWCVPTR